MLLIFAPMFVVVGIIGMIDWILKLFGKKLNYNGEFAICLITVIAFFILIIVWGITTGINSGD